MNAERRARAAFYRNEAAAFRHVNGDPRVIRWLEAEAERLEAAASPFPVVVHRISSRAMVI